MSSPQLTTAAYADRSYEALKPYKVVKPCSFISLHSNLTLLLSSFHGQRNRRPLPCSADRFTSSFVLREALYLRSSAQERIPQHPTHNSECSKPCPRASSMLLMFLSFLIASTGITLSILYQSVWFLIAQAFVLAVLFTLFISTVKLQYAARVPGVALSFANDAVYLSPRYEDPFPYLSISSIRHFGVVAVHRRERNIGQGVTGSEQASENSCYCLEVITLGEVLLIGSCTSKQSITIMADEANAHLQRMREEGIALFPPPSLFTEDQDDYQQASVQLTSTWDSSVILPRTHGVTVEHPGDQTVIIRFHNPQRCASSVKAILLVMLVSAMIYFVTNCENCHLLQRLYWTLPSVIYSVGMFLAMNFISCEWTTIVFSQERKPCFFVPPLMWMLRRTRYVNIKQFNKVFFRRSTAKGLKGGGIIPRKSPTITRGGRRYEVELKSTSLIGKNARFSQLCEGQALTIAQQLVLIFPFLCNSSSETYSQV